MNLKKQGFAVNVIATLLLIYGLGSWHSFNNAFLAPSWIALIMGLIGAVLIFSVAAGKKHLDVISQLIVGLCMAMILLAGFAARADLATYDPIGNIIRWGIVAGVYVIAMICSYGAIAPPQLKRYIN